MIVVRICLLLAFLAILARANDVPKGVRPEEVAQYKKHHQNNKFVCLDNSKTIEYSQVNDDYCDCADGSDEPGTSACAKADRIPTMFYCQNKGYIPKRIFSSFVNDGICDCCDGSDEYDGKTKCPNTCMSEGKEIKAKLEQKIVDLKRGLAIRASYAQQATKELLAKANEVAEKKKHLTVLESELADLTKAKQEAEAIEEAERNALRERKQKEKEEAAKNAPPPEETPAPVAEGDATTPAPVPPAPQEDEEVKNYKNEDAEKARTAETQKRNEVDHLRREIEDIEKLLNTDFGPQKEFYVLKGKTINFQDRQYTYELQPFGTVTQKETNGAHTSLGTFNKFDKDHTEMHHTGGITCWQGPARSTTVTLECSGVDEHRIIKVDEPSRCVYKMVLTTPAACRESDLRHLEEELAQFLA
jgi:protein kinase C substrate 80K-H